MLKGASRFAVRSGASVRRVQMHVDVERLNRHGYPIDRTGMDAWSLAIKRENDKRMKTIEAKSRPELRAAEIVEDGHEIPLESLTRRTKIGKLGHLAVEAGWTVKAGESMYRTAERWVKEAVVPGKLESHRWVQGVSPDRRHHFSASTSLIMLDGWPVDSIEEALIHVTELGEAK